MQACVCTCCKQSAAGGGNWRETSHILVANLILANDQKPQVVTWGRQGNRQIHISSNTHRNTSFAWTYAVHVASSVVTCFFLSHPHFADCQFWWRSPFSGEGWPCSYCTTEARTLACRNLSPYCYFFFCKFTVSQVASTTSVPPNVCTCNLYLVRACMVSWCKGICCGVYIYT